MWMQDKGRLPKRAQKMWITAKDERVCVVCGPSARAEGPGQPAVQDQARRVLDSWPAPELPMRGAADREPVQQSCHRTG